jgi:hypothetical protein
VVENAFGILSQKFQIFQKTLQSLPENADRIIFAACILHNYPRDQVVGLSDTGSSRMFEAILQKYQTKEVKTLQADFSHITERDDAPREPTLFNPRLL